MSSITDFTLEDVQKYAGGVGQQSSGGGEGGGYASATEFVNAVGAALERQESGGKQLRPDGTPVTSKAGAIGRWQLMPKTAQEAARLAGVPFDDVKYRTDGEYNAMLGRAYLAKQYDDFQDPAKALAAYNAGPDAVNRAVTTADKQGNQNGWLNYLPSETRNYVPAIIARVNGLNASGAPAKSGQYYTPSSTNYATYKDPGPGATFGDYIKGVASSAVDSLGSVGQAAGEVAAAVANKATGTEQYVGKNLLKPVSKAIDETMTEGGKRANEDSAIEGSVFDLLSGDAKLPKTLDGYLMTGARGFGSLLTMIFPEIGLAGRVGEATNAANAAMKASKVAEAAGDAAMAAQKAQEAAKLMEQAKAASTTLKTVGGGLNAAMTGGAAAEDVRTSADKAVSSMSHNELMSNVPVYAEVFKQTGNEQQARDAVVNSAARWAGTGAAAFGAAGGALNAKIIEDTILHKGLSTMIGNSAKSVTGRAALGAAGGALVEGGQEVAEKVGQNVGENVALGRPATDNAMRDTAGDFLGGAMVGHPTGAIAGAMAQPGQNGQPAAPVAPVIPPVLQPVAETAAAGGVLSKAALAGNAGNIAAAAADPIGARVAAVENDLRSNGTLEKIRGFGPDTSNEFLYALNVARNPNTDPTMRQRAIDQVEHVLNTAKSGTGFVMQPNTQPQPGTDLAVRDNNAVAPNGLGQYFDPNTVEGDVRRVDNALPGPAAQAQSAQPQPQTNTPAQQQSVATPTEATVPKVEVPPGEGPAERRKRGAELREMASNGFETVQRDGDKFYMVNSKTNQRLTLRGPADAQMARKAIQDRVDGLAHTAASSPNNDLTAPTEGQIKAGNYKKSDVIDLNGVKIKIENPKGSVRRGTSPDGVMWETKMAHHYGEMQGTIGADGDKVDVFIGPRADSNKIYVVDQVNQDGSFDEHKVMMGFTSEADARAGYLANYEKGWTGLGAITEMSPEQFREWAKSRAAKKPLALNENGKQAGKPLEKAVAAEGEGSKAKFATLGEAKAYISQQRRGNSSISALPVPNEDGSFGVAVKGTPEYAKAEKFSRDQQKAEKKAKSKASKQKFIEIDNEGTKVKLPIVEKSDLPKTSTSQGRTRQLTQDDLTALEAVAAILGKRVQVFHSPDTTFADGFTLSNDSKHIFINTYTTVNPMAVFGHELFHTIEQSHPEAWKAISKVVAAQLGEEAAAKLTKRGYESDKHLSEITSDIGGDLLSDATFWQEVFKQIEQDNGPEAKNIIARLVAYLNNLVAKLVVGINQPGFNSAPIVKDFNAVRAAYREGMVEFIKTAALSQQALQAQITREEQSIKKSKPVAGQQPETGIHFSKAQRDVLMGDMHGTGLRGAERERLDRSNDARLKSRVSFYVDEGKGIVPEAGVGGHAHEINLPKLYNLKDNPEGLYRDGGPDEINASESRILNAGYDGYWVPSHSNGQGVGVILGKAAKAVEAKPASPNTRSATQPAEATHESRGLMSREMDAIDVNNIPGAKLRSGTLVVPVGSREQANKELSRIGAAVRFSKPLLDDVAQDKSQYEQVEAQYKGTDKWMKAPNGEPTQLSERQWVQVRTPNFKKWFGDWEAAAANGGVWGTMHGEVSVAVDKNGEPLVVYHGTNKGGFSEFNTPGGEKRGDLGIYTTPNLAMAQTYYSRRGGEISLEDTSSLKGLLDAGFDIYDDVDFAELYDPEGNFLGRYDSAEEAKKVLVEEYAGIKLSNQEQSGYYAMFINMRQPNEVDFEGAHWNGERPGQFIVTKLFEQQYDDDGRGYFDNEEDAQAFADKINGYVEEAPQDAQSTDSVVREAYRYGNDGALIRSVVDTGPGFSAYIDEPSDVFVALDPSQLKSANYNDGSFSVTSSDLRFSKPVAEEDAKVRQYKLDIEREQRAVGKAARLSADEVAALAADGSKLGLNKAQINAMADDARRIKKQFPESEDWAPMTVMGITLKTDEEGNVVEGSQKPKFQIIPYSYNVPPGKDRAPAKVDEQWMNKVAVKFEGLVLDIYDRAEKGDKNAQIIIGHQTWYRNVAAVLRREYGGSGDLLADLLGATSPNTPVDTNWKFSLDVMRRFMAGEFNEQLSKFAEYLDKGGNPYYYPSADKIRQISGKLYGMNSTNAMKALVDVWRVIEPKAAPKARNFALNLIGQSNMATIDVWAARMLRRAADLVRGANLPRIPPPAEGAVTGEWNADASRVTGAFGFGAEVMDKVSAALDKRGIKVSPPDLQAIAWFAEKELWGQKGWTTKAGEGGSFEENIEATPVDRFLAGWSIQQGERVPSKDKASVAQARVMSMLIGDDSVIAARVMPTSGLYGGTVEASFDTEWTAMKGRHDPSMAVAEIAKIAQENNQLDIFVSKVVGPKDLNANARPGAEIYFRTARDLEAAKPILDKFTAHGQDGFTMVVDPRATPKGVAGEQFIGVRLQYVPEIAMRFDPALRESMLKDGAIEELLNAKREQLNDITAEVRAMDGVAFAAMQNYDTVVVGKENYSDYIDRIAEEGNQSSGSQAWFGQSLRQGLERAAARLGGNVGQDSSGSVPSTGGSVRFSRPIGDGSGRQGAGQDARGSLEESERSVSQEALKPLPGAPEVKGFTGPDPRLVAVAEKYAQEHGIDLKRQANYVEVDEARAKRIAQAYEDMPHAPQDPKVKAAYKNLIEQALAQYQALADAGYKFWFIDMDRADNREYVDSPWNAMRDIRANKEMGIFPTADGFGSNESFDPVNNPLLEDTGIKWPVGGPDSKQTATVLANDIFRAVHDAFGHGLEGAGFRARGEENAWQAHRRLFTGSAVGALTSETRGQNSWLNYGPHGEKNRSAKVEDTTFADQKTGLMPAWTWEEGVDGDGPDGGGKVRKSKPIAERFPDTPEFKKWFGDSNTVNASGDPIVFYRGQGASFNNGSLKGRYFTSDPAYASTYDFDSDVNVLPVYIKAENIYMPEDVNDVTDDNFNDAELLAKGYDAIATKDLRIIVPLKSDSQIKSAVGNNGEYSSTNPDIRKSKPILDNIGNISVGNGYKLNDLIKSSKTLSWWDRTVGTMYNIAEKHPEFKRVYDAVQRFINDVSYFATRAADLAPTILPKLDSWKDIGKSPLSAEDVKALAGPVFQGTLSFARDENGELMPEDDPQKAGVVFTDKELRDYWQLDDRQIGLYHEFRNAADRSITDLALSDVLRFLGEDGEGIRQRLMQANSVDQARREVDAHLDLLIEQNPERSEVLENAKDAVSQKFDQAERLMDRGYAPLSRFGQYTVYVVGKNGEQLYFSMFETQREANKMASEMQEWVDDEHPGGTVTTGVMSQESYKLFSGVTPETLSLFAESLGLEESGIDPRSQAFQEFLKQAKSNRSAMKRLIQRKGIQGFSEDVGRVLAGFVYSNARQVSTNLHAGEIAKSANDVHEGDVKDAAIRLMQYVQNPANEAQAVRGMLFANFIGGSVASALVNMTQPFTMTMPYLSQFSGVKAIGRVMADAVKLTVGGIKDDDELAKALKYAEDEGIVSPQEVHQLMGQAQGKGALQTGDGTKAGDALAKVNNTLAKVSLGWGKLFSTAEQFNRRVTFIAAYKLAREQGMADPMAFAEKAIAETQGVYNKGNRPEWARGAVGATLFTFKQYSIGYVEFLQRMWGNGPEGKMAVGMALGVLFFASGLGGMPGADDLDDVIDGVAQRVFNKSFSSKAARREFLMKYLGEGMTDFVMQGVSSIPGVPVDISGRMGLGNLVPGTGFFVKKQDHASDYKEFAGPAGTFFSNLGMAAASAAQGEFGKAIETMAPVAAQNVYKGLDMAQMGYYRDYKGRKVIDTTLTEAILKGAGFQPTNVARIQQASREQQGLIALNKIRETEIADLWASGRIERDQSKIDRAKEELVQWNKDNPESPIKIDSNQISKRVQQANKDKAKRLSETAPKEIRATVKRELERATD